MRHVVIAALLIALAVHAAAQPAARPAFDVASIKANKSGDNSMFVNILPGGRFMVRNATLRELVQAAYQFQYQAFQILGGAGWIDTERFNIDAKADGTFSPAQVSAMVQNLLADRFHLVLRSETQQLPTYALVVARSDARPGSLLRAAAGCVTAPIGRGAPASAEANAPPRCGLHFDSGRDNGLRMRGDGVTMQQLAERLQFYVQRVVVDDTKLTGKFDLALEFMPDRRRPSVADAPGQPAPDSGLSVVTALQEQLGLRLNSQRGDVKVLVIDSAERPTEN